MVVKPAPVTTDSLVLLKREASCVRTEGSQVEHVALVKDRERGSGDLLADAGWAAGQCRRNPARIELRMRALLVHDLGQQIARDRLGVNSDETAHRQCEVARRCGPDRDSLLLKVVGAKPPIVQVVAEVERVPKAREMKREAAVVNDGEQELSELSAPTRGEGPGAERQLRVEPALP